VGSVFDPELLGDLRERARIQIRARMRALRNAFPEAALGARSARIVERVSTLDAYRSARSIALFWPLAREVDLRALDTLARGHGKRVYYPVMDPTESGFSTGFGLSQDPGELAPRSERFLEPPADAPRAARADVDLILVPALAVGANGHRLGYGRGFYDVTLPDFRPPAKSVVVAYEFQLLSELPELGHDVASDLVVTDARTLVV
jgi:5-formyltetrahydrofolate cyclo-ligase